MFHQIPLVECENSPVLKNINGVFLLTIWTPNLIAHHNQKSVLIFSVPLVVSVFLSSFHRWKIKSHIIVTLWES